MAEIKMGAIRKRKIDEDRKLGSCWRPPKQVTVLGLMCEKMAERALAAQEKVEEREAAHALASVTSVTTQLQQWQTWKTKMRTRTNPSGS